MFPIDELCEKIDKRLVSLSAGPALVYLMRRFGFPNAGSDDHKHVCAYALPIAGMPETNLLITIHGQIARIGWQAQRELYYRYIEEMQTLRGEGAWEILPGTAFMRQCHDAATSALVDLCRPTYVRDVAITIFGDDGDGSSEVAEPYVGAGNALDPAWMAQADLFLEFLEFVELRGQGDRAAGMRSIMEVQHG